MSDYDVNSGMNFDPITGERIKPLQTAETKPAEAEQPAETAQVSAEAEKPIDELARATAEKLNEAPAGSTDGQYGAAFANNAGGQASSPYFDRITAAGDRNVYDYEYRERQEAKPAGKAKKAKKERRQKQGGGFFRKAVAAVALAVIFGGVAGGTFYGICRMTGVLEKNEELTAPQIAGEVLDNQAKLPVKQSDVTENSDREVKLVNSDNIQVISTDISDMVEEVIPAMVTIVNTGKDEWDFWGRSYTPQSSGTGVIIGENDTDLLIVTNHHVAKDAKQLDITFIDDFTAKARVKGMDSDMDLAVLAVSLNDIPQETKDKIVVAQLGDSDSLKLGQPAVVIGNALGIGISVTDGVISGLNREMTTEDGNTGTFIQTDAAVNHGNSGGALLNIKGEVVGIVSNKIDGESVEGMGYAIPISAASPIIQELMERQTRSELVDASEQGYLGVSLQTVTSDAREYYGLPDGAYVYRISEGSGAQKAGIQKGDVITKIEKIKVSSNAEAREILQYYRQGEEVTVNFSRLENGEYVEHEVTVVLGAPEVRQ